jgi:hypothetical protein
MSEDVAVGDSKRIRLNKFGFDLAISLYRGCPMPGLDVELRTPFGTIGGYIHA